MIRRPLFPRTGAPHAGTPGTTLRALHYLPFILAGALVSATVHPASSSRLAPSRDPLRSFGANNTGRDGSTERIAQAAAPNAYSAVPGVNPMEGSIVAAQSNSDATVGGVMKSIDCFVDRRMLCERDACENAPFEPSSVNFNFASRVWQSPPGTGATGQIRVLDASPPLLGQPLWVAFEFTVNDQLGTMRSKITAKPMSPGGNYSITLAMVSGLKPDGAKTVWSGQCNIDVFAR